MSIERRLEKTLFKLIKKNDESAFEILFKLYYSELCNYAVTFVKVRDIAEDIVQETFIKIWERRDKINVEVSWKAYIYRSVHNQCINYLKKRKILKKQNQDMIDKITDHLKVANFNFNPNSLDKLIAEELAQSLREAINNLPEQCRNIFFMSRNDKLSYSQIAEKLGISQNTVKTQMKKALKKLREILDKYLRS